MFVVSACYLGAREPDSRERHQSLSALTECQLNECDKACTSALLTAHVLMYYLLSSHRTSHCIAPCIAMHGLQVVGRRPSSHTTRSPWTVQTGTARFLTRLACCTRKCRLVRIQIFRSRFAPLMLFEQLQHCPFCCLLCLRVANASTCMAIND
jgi:hypothetical protein